MSLGPGVSSPVDSPPAASLRPSSLRGHYAGFVTRAVAFIIDFLLVVMTQVVVLLIIRLLLQFFGLSTLAQALFYPDTAGVDSSVVVTATRWTILVIGSNLLFDAYMVIGWLLVDRTIGQAALGLRVRRSDGRPLTIGPAIRRVIGYYLSILPLFLGFLWVLVDDRRQGWHDKLADTVVIYDWEARLGRRLRQWLARQAQG